MRYRTQVERERALQVRAQARQDESRYSRALEEDRILRAYEVAYIELYGVKPFIVKRGNSFSIGRNSMYLKEFEQATRILQAKLHALEIEDGKD